MTSEQLYRQAIEAFGTIEDLGRFDRGFMSDDEAERFLRRAVFAEEITGLPKRRTVGVWHASSACPGRTVEDAMRTEFVRCTLVERQYAALHAIERAAQASEAPIPELAGLGRYTVAPVAIRARCAVCGVDETVRFVRVTWEHVESGVLIAMERAI